MASDKWEDRPDVAKAWMVNKAYRCVRPGRITAPRTTMAVVEGLNTVRDNFGVAPLETEVGRGFCDYYGGKR